MQHSNASPAKYTVPVVSFAESSIMIKKLMMLQENVIMLYFAAAHRLSYQFY
jgi:hypothetical protein